MDGWVDGWVGGWVEAKAVLRIAYSNQKGKHQKNKHHFKAFVESALDINFTSKITFQ